MDDQSFDPTSMILGSTHAVVPMSFLNELLRVYYGRNEPEQPKEEPVEEPVQEEELAWLHHATITTFPENRPGYVPRGYAAERLRKEPPDGS